MKRMSLLLFATTVIFSVSTVQAEEKTDCAVKYTRTACPGKEAESYKKCDGKKSCTQYKPASSAEECQAAALKACANDRLDITKSKVINAAYKGKPIKSTSGKDDFCVDYPNRSTEFDKCS
ncbi:MAG: hypothetical protein HY308_13230 [Gammaproteobacteria bacterium]|nr:hypothetical protein [Gammaproteobacteria bacterium]